MQRHLKDYKTLAYIYIYTHIYTCIQHAKSHERLQDSNEGQEMKMTMSLLVVGEIQYTGQKSIYTSHLKNTCLYMHTSHTYTHIYITHITCGYNALEIVEKYQVVYVCVFCVD